MNNLLSARWLRYDLSFKMPATTSRGALTQKPTWFLFLQNNQTDKIGIGECNLLAGLSIDYRDDFEAKLTEVCQRINGYQQDYQHSLTDFPAIQFALETALLDLSAENMLLFPSAFTESKQTIPINGLIWMASRREMQQQIDEKLQQGFRCLKLKISTLNFIREYELLAAIRKHYSADEIEIRVDANGAFKPEEALKKLQLLADLQIHSIEQPIAPGQYAAMADLVEKSPLAVALDEELMGISKLEDRIALLDTIKPDYLILKPSLLGGFQQASQWITLAQQRNINWWITSALESNLGLNAIAQWTATLNNPLTHGLGTGLLYRNNLPSALFIHAGQLHFKAPEDLSHQVHKFFADV
jgi:o-succinylbenzoate synthase